MSEPNCTTCRFFMAHYSEASPQGFCRLNPPAVFGPVEQQESQRYPVVSEHTWCSHWQQREPQAEAAPLKFSLADIKCCAPHPKVPATWCDLLPRHVGRHRAGPSINTFVWGEPCPSRKGDAACEISGPHKGVHRGGGIVWLDGPEPAKPEPTDPVAFLETLRTDIERMPAYRSKPVSIGDALYWESRMVAFRTNLGRLEVVPMALQCTRERSHLFYPKDEAESLYERFRRQGGLYWQGDVAYCTLCGPATSLFATTVLYRVTVKP